MNKMIISLIFYLFILSSSFTEGEAKIFNVDTCSGIKSALNNISSGDSIIVDNGNYTCGNLSISKSGNQHQLIEVKARNSGKAILKNETLFEIDGDYVHLNGFTFDNSGVIVRGNYNLISGNFFKNGRHTSKAAAAIRIDGSKHNRVAYNEIGPWKTYGIRVLPRGGRPTGNLIDHNYIHDMTGERRNGSEAIQVGSSREHTTFEMNTIIEYNLIERVEIDSEIISLKCSSNIVRFNTFKDSNASVVGRHGRRNEFYGNTLINVSALKAFGNDHKLISNSLRNTDIKIPAGNITQEATEANPTSAKKHPAAFNVLVADNNVKNGTIIVGDTMRTGVPATNTILAGNEGKIVYKDHKNTKVEKIYSGKTYEPVILETKYVGPSAEQNIPVPSGNVRLLPPSSVRIVETR